MAKRFSAFLMIIVVLLTTNLPCNLAKADNAGFVRVEAGETHVVALKSDGTVWTWGSNMCGALGDGTERSRYVPAKVEGVEEITDIAAGRAFSIALKADGTVWGWGNPWVQLGLEYHPRQLEKLKHIVAISIMDTAFYALDSNGNIYLNYEKIEMHDFPYKKRDAGGVYKVFSNGSYGTALGLKEDGSVWHNGVEIAEFQGAKDVAVFQGLSGETTGYVVLASGVIVAVGSNRYGQLGNGFPSYTNIPQKIEGILDVKDISALHDIYVLHNDGTVSTMYNRNHEFHFIKVPITNVKKIVQTSHSAVVLKKDGTVWEWAVDHSSPAPKIPEPVKIEGLSDIVNISATQGTLLAFDKNGKIVNEPWKDKIDDAVKVTDGYADGFSNLILLTEDLKILREYDYSIGGGSLDSVPIRKHRELKEVDINGKAKHIEVQLPDTQGPIVLKEDGTVCVLSSIDGVDKCTDILNLPPITDIRARFGAILALDTEGSVWQLGTTVSGNLGGDDHTEYHQPYLIPGLSGIKAIAAGKDYYFAVTENSELYAWGENGENQLFPSDYYTNYTAWKPIKSSVINMTIGNATILVNNHSVDIPAAPVIYESRTLVPIREVVENLGGIVEWEDSGKITVKTDEQIIVMNIGSREAQFNGTAETLDIAPAMIHEKTFLPLRYICEKLDAEVLWEETAQRITITK